MTLPSLRPATIVVLAVVLCACAEPLELAPWTIDVPEGTRIVEYAHVPDGERTERIDLVEDLVIGAGDDPVEAFYGARDVAVDDDGNIYVLDGGNDRVQVFDPEGRYLRSLGAGEGQGPGELGVVPALAVVGDTVVLADSGNSRYSVWSLDGEHLGDHATERRYANVDQLTGLPGGDLLARYGYGRLPETAFVVARLSVEGEELERYVEVESSSIAMPRAGSNAQAPGLQLPFALPGGRFLSPDGLLLTRADEYQVLATDLDGTPRWALRVAMPRPPFSAGEEAVRAKAREQWSQPTLEVSDYATPEHFPALSRIAVDGQGRLYVFPFVGSAVYRPADGDVPVDVYSAAGERLFAGRMPDVDWRAARGELVYALRTGETSAEQEVVRYRLDLPFE